MSKIRVTSSLAFIGLAAGIWWVALGVKNCPNYANYSFDFSSSKIDRAAEVFNVEYRFFLHEEDSILLPSDHLRALRILHGTNKNDTQAWIKYDQEISPSQENPLLFNLTFRKHPSGSGLIIDEIGEKTEGMKSLVLELSPQDKCPSRILGDHNLVSVPFEYD